MSVCLCRGVSDIFIMNNSHPQLCLNAYIQRRKIVDTIEGRRLEVDDAVVVQIPVKIRTHR